MDPKQYIEQQRKDWNRVAPAWEKWDRHLDQNLAFISYRLMKEAGLIQGQRVLDLGCGTGYPAILAAQTVGEEGAVTALDLSEEMLAIARRKARDLDLTNIEFQTEDAAHLPFDPTSFDSVISRFCLMFLPDIPKALKEVARVLKDGGYFAAVVWSTADKNPFMRVPVEVLRRFIEIPPPDPGQPGVFRLSRPGDLMGMAESAGLSGITDEEVISESIFDSADEYIANIRELAAPLQSLFARLTEVQRDKVENEIRHSINQFQHGGKIVLPMAFRIIAARKP